MPLSGSHSSSVKCLDHPWFGFCKLRYQLPWWFRKVLPNSVPIFPSHLLRCFERPFWAPIVRPRTSGVSHLCCNSASTWVDKMSFVLRPRLELHRELQGCSIILHHWRPIRPARFCCSWPEILLGWLSRSHMWDCKGFGRSRFLTWFNMTTILKVVVRPICFYANQAFF